MITEREVRREEKKWEKEKDLLTRYKKVKDERRAFNFSKLPRISTTKILMVLLFLNCTAVEVFTGYITLKNFELSLITDHPLDLTPLVTLVGAVVSEVIGFAVYSLKASKENTKGGIIFERAMKELENEYVEENDDEING